jgi:cytochrome c oxidase subunit 2
MRFCKAVKKFPFAPATLTAMAAILGGCQRNYQTPMSTISTRSDLAAEISSLFTEITILDSVVLVIVLVAFVAAVFWFSSRPGDDDGDPGAAAPDHGSHVALELAWSIGPALILLFITIPTVRTIIRTQPNRWPADTFTIQVRAHQWWWEFYYPSLKIHTADEIHIPANTPVHFELYSDDIIHSFWIPQLGGKRDVIPGQVNSITMIAHVPGEYYGQCVEFCGDSHANMRFRAFVDSPDAFKKWTAAQLAPPVEPTTPAAIEGEKIYKNAPCAICHTIRGISGFSPEYRYGFRGPDLTHFGSRTTLAGSILANTPENVALWIQNPDAIKPGAQMPKLGLRGAELHDLVAYLESLK